CGAKVLNQNGSPEGGGPNSESDWSPVHDAAFNGRLLALQRLIAQVELVVLTVSLFWCCGYCSQGPCVNTSTVDGQTPLSEACARGHVTCVSLLLQHGANPSGTSQSSSPIHRAAAKGHPECIEPLVQHGANVDEYVERSGSPLHAACSNRQLSTVRKLLQLGACVNSRMSGNSPLHIAARLSSPELVSVLLDHGADHSLRNREGKQPLDLAPPNSLVERLLRQTGGVSPLMQMCRLHIRKSVGKQRLVGIHDLPLPADIKLYLLYQSNPRGDQMYLTSQTTGHFSS
uniref:SOCS box domain-containing protein n=1 Tax=Mola mola TaxID=94237 RepID=A0A3Q3XIX2_MOLML